MRDSQSNPNLRDFHGGRLVKNPPFNAGDTGSVPGWGRNEDPACSRAAKPKCCSY